ncbi:hypothetical protein PM082_014175 [Marasmius tenuissimus]|nr:hypothetical protein PM082_014175 [Marasmius tenuissimus]
MERQTVTQNQQTGSGFQNNNTATGTQNINFINSFNSAASHPHKTLWNSVAGIGASHTAEQQYERGECLKGTRRRTLKMIHDWRRGKGGDEPICLLSGAAGVGKSAIAMTVAKSCEEKGVLVSSFFFFRSDPKRNNHSALVPVIAHGLVTTIPSCRDLINQRIADDPKILEAQLEVQFRELVLRPFVSQALGPDTDQDPSAAVARKTSPNPLVLGGPSPRQYRRWWQLIWTIPFFWSFVQQNEDLPREDHPNRRDHFTEGGEDASQSVSRQDVAAREDYPGGKDNSAYTKGPTLVIIDGLDECGGEAAQRRILSTILSAFQQQPQFSMKFLICSRPEAWIREAFSTKPLSLLSNVIVLDESFVPDQDIRKYYCHHFHEISNRPKFNHVQFPIPWPSEDDLEDLVDRSCGQFAHAATTVKLIDSEFKHPIVQLRSLLQHTTPRRPGSSPYQQLDALYDYILGVNPDYEEVSLILATVLVVPPKARTPACIDLLLGLPAGQVTMTIRGMHSVLDIRGPWDEINLFHTSFRDYLTDQARSRQFHIDLDSQKYAVARHWLKNLTTGKVQTYSSEELYGENNMVFFTEWIGFCVSIPEPTRDLLKHLSGVDLTFTYLIEMIRCHLRTYATWNNRFAYLVPWVKTYVNSQISEDERETGERLMQRLQNRPKRFHLQCSADVRNDVLYWVIDRATKCPGSTRLDGSPPRDFDNLRLTDCHCSLSGGKESQDAGHLAYQDACLQLVKAFVSLFEMLAHDGSEDDETIRELGNVFLNVAHLLRLQHCRLGTELLLLCRTFFGLAKGCSVMRIVLVDEMSGLKDSMLSWTETFPRRFAHEGEALRAQILELPWEEWELEYDTCVYNIPDLWSIRYRA